MTGAPVTFAAVAQQLAEHGWRPFPGFQASKTPAMRGWPGLNHSEWDGADLVAAIGDYQPADDFCCCLAVQREIVAIDLDIIDPEHAAAADRLANEMLGKTPLVRIGLAPKQIRIYRSGDLIRSRKLHPLEIFSGTGQFIAYGWHEKAGRPYIWPQCFSTRCERRQRRDSVGDAGAAEIASPPSCSKSCRAAYCRQDKAGRSAPAVRKQSASG